VYFGDLMIDTKNRGSWTSLCTSEFVMSSWGCEWCRTPL